MCICLQFRIFCSPRTVVDELLDISDILSRLITCKDVYGKPSEAAASLLMFTEVKLAWNPLIQCLLVHSRPLIPLTMDRANAILEIHHWFLNVAEDEGIMARLEAGEIPGFMFESVGDEDTPWHDVVETLRLWVWENPGGCNLNGMEIHLDLLLLDWTSDPH